jgi:hypothetical protein
MMGGRLEGREPVAVVESGKGGTEEAYPEGSDLCMFRGGRAGWRKGGRAGGFCARSGEVLVTVVK